jgi:hypothetical protein
MSSSFSTTMRGLMSISDACQQWEPRGIQGFPESFYSECLTRNGCYIAYYYLDPMRILALPTEAQEALQDHG